MKFLRSIVAVMLLSLLSSCAADMDVYKGQTPEFDLARFFDGDVMAYGVVTDISDQMTRRFSVRIEGQWQGTQGQLDEYFEFADGETQFRRWRIQQTSPGQYQGQADDIIGMATGVQQGPVLQWQYEMDLQVEDDSWRVSFDDKMFLLDDKRMINHARIKKFGITVANVLIYFEKVG